MENNLLLRRAILLQLEAAAPASLPSETILNGLEISGFKCDLKLLLGNLDYLEQKGMLATACSKISSAHLRAKLTASGRDYIEGGEF